jgi:sugar phosphate isomerase/epimerase
MLWGYAGIWPKEFTQGRGWQSLEARLEFIAQFGLDCTVASPAGLDKMDAAERDRCLRLLDERDLCLTFAVWGIYWVDEDEAKRQTEAALEAVARWKDRVRAPIVTTGGGGPHRFSREPPLEAQLDRLAERLAPLAAGFAELGIPFGIENHGDYYVSDLVELCARVPGLGIFLDTGNCFLIGERPAPAIQAAAPFTIGTHFKDHRVRPRHDARPLHFEVGPSVLGEGDVGLRDAYATLIANAPHPEDLVMEIEMVPPPEMDPFEALRRSIAFVRSLTVPPDGEGLGAKSR